MLALSLAAGDAFAWQSPVGQDAESDRAVWEKVRDIAADKEIEVETREPDRLATTVPVFTGHLQKWQPDSLVLQLRNDREREISRSLVRRVSLREKGNRAKGAMWGALAGFGIGAGIGANVKIADRTPTSGDRLLGALVIGGVWAAIGALVGRQAASAKLVTVYQAQRRWVTATILLFAGAHFA